MILTWFNSLTKGWKAATIIAVLAFLIILSLWARISYLNYAAVKRLKNDIEAMQTKQKELEESTTKTITSGKTINQKFKDKNKAIDQNLKQDEENINNSNYSNTKLDSLLSSYGN